MTRNLFVRSTPEQHRLGLRAPDDDCTTASAYMSASGLISADTSASTSTTDLPTCGSINLDEPKEIWVVFDSSVYDYGVFSLTHLGGSSLFSQGLILYDGFDCASLGCVAGAEDELTVSLTTNQFYYLIVTGYPPSNYGAFTLSFNLFANSECDNAEEISLGLNNGQLYEPLSTTLTCDVAHDSAFLRYSAPSVAWYTFFSGGENFVTIEVCTEIPVPEALTILLSQDTCNDYSTTCLVTSSQDCVQSISKTIRPNFQYYIAVSGSPTLFQLDFGLSVAPLQSSARCAQATPIVSSPVSGSTFGAADTSILSFDCNGDLPFIGYSIVWYTISTATFNKIRLDICDASALSKVFLFEGSCASLQCAVYGGSQCGNGYTLTKLQLSSSYIVAVMADISATEDSVYTLNAIRSAEQPPSNNDCGQALILESGDYIFPFAFSTFSTISPCNTLNSPDVWFIFDRGSNTHVFAQVCSEELTRFNFALYRPPCATLTCVTAATQSTSIAECAGNSGAYLSVDISAPLNPMFMLSVYSPPDYYYLGEFSLTFDLLTPDPFDRCENAIDISLSNSFSGSNELATPDHISAFVACSHPVSVTTRNVWFQFSSGPATKVLIDCSGASFIAFDAVISLFTGVDCNSLTCANSTAFVCPTEFSSILRRNTNYFLSVSGETYRDFGDFSLSIRYLLDPPSNDECANGEGLNILGNQGSGSTAYASPDSIVYLCGLRPPINYFPNVWYRFFVPDFELVNHFLFSVCSVSGSPPELTLFTGQCDALQCVAGARANCFPGSELSSYIARGRTYFLSVASEDLDFDFTYSFDFISPMNEDCLSAEQIQSTPAVIFGSNREFSGALEPEACSGVPFTTTAALYRITSNFNNIFISFCAEYGGQQGQPMRIHLYNSTSSINCPDDLQCISADTIDCSSSPVSFQSAIYGEDTQYLLAVSPALVTGTFLMYIELYDNVENDNCADAIPITGNIISNNLIGATYDPLSALCAGDSEQPNVWYSFSSNGFNALKVDGCTYPNYANFPMEINVYQGVCGDARCLQKAVETQDISTCATSFIRVYHLSEPTYLLSVQANTIQLGSFSIETELFQMDIPQNDLCSAAVTIIGPSATLASNTEGSFLDVPSPCPLVITPPTSNIWYTFYSGVNTFISMELSSVSTARGHFSLFSASEQGCLGPLTCEASGTAAFQGITPQTTYLISVESTNYNVGAFVLSVTLVARVATSCTTGIPLLPSPPFNSITILSDWTLNVLSTPLQCNSLSSNARVTWFRFNSASFNVVALSLCDTFVVVDTKLYLFPALPDCPPLPSTCVAANDNGCNNQGLSSLQSSVSTNTEYIVAVVAPEAFRNSVFSLQLTLSNGPPVSSPPSPSSPSLSPSSPSLSASSPSLSPSSPSRSPSSPSGFSSPPSPSSRSPSFGLSPASSPSSPSFGITASTRSPALSGSSVSPTGGASGPPQSSGGGGPCPCASPSGPVGQSGASSFTIPNTATRSGASSGGPLPTTRSQGGPGGPCPCSTPTFPRSGPSGANPSLFPTGTPANTRIPCPSTTPSFKVEFASILPPPPMEAFSPSSSPRTNPEQPFPIDRTTSPAPSAPSTTAGTRAPTVTTDGPPPIALTQGESVEVPVESANQKVSLENQNGEIYFSVVIPPVSTTNDEKLEITSVVPPLRTDIPFQSAIISLTLTNVYGEEITSFDDAVELCFIVPDPHDDKLCLSYYDEAKGEWICDDPCVEVKGDKACGETNHFTNFAILLNGNAEDCEDEFDLTLTYISSASVFIALVIIVLVIPAIEIFYRRKRKLRNAQMNVAKKQKALEAARKSRDKVTPVQMAALVPQGSSYFEESAASVL